MKILKKMSVSLLVILLCIASFAEEITVTVSGEGNKFSKKLKESLVVKAKKSAIRKYAQRLNSNIEEDKLRTIINEFSKFVEDIIEEESKWQKLTEDHGEYTKTYSIELDTDKLGQELAKIGFNAQGVTELIILEEPPSAGDMDLKSEDLNNFIFNNYTEFQRSIRDIISKKNSEAGFKCKDLEDDEMYEAFKSKDSTLMGVFYNHKEKKFDIHKDLINEIKDNNPDTIIFYYRIAALIYEPSEKLLKATISLSLKKMGDKTTTGIGKQRYSLSVSSINKMNIIDNLSLCAENAITLIMNEEGKKQLKDSIMAINNSSSENEPIVLTMNLKVIDKKIRKRMGYAIKKKLILLGFVEDKNIKLRGNNLSATLKQTGNSEDFYYDKLDPILQDIGLELSDESIFCNGHKITIKPVLNEE